MRFPRTLPILLLALGVATAGCFGGGGPAGADGSGAAADGGHDHADGDHHFPTALHTVPATVSQGPSADPNPGGAGGAGGAGAGGNGTAGGSGGSGTTPKPSPSPEPSDTPEPGSSDPDDPGPGPKRSPVTWVVTIRGGAFENASLTVQIHDTVRWVHDDGPAHTVVADDGEFDSGYVHEDPMVRGDAYEKMFDVTGYYPYHCSLHPGMTGSVFVRERWDATPPA